MRGDVGALREWVGAAVERDGLREMARQLELTPTGLSNFLAGSTPTPHTLTRLRRWVVREQAAGLVDGVPADPSAREAAVGLLLTDLWPSVQARVGPELVDAAGVEPRPPAEPDDPTLALVEAVEQVLQRWNKARAGRLRKALEAWKRMEREGEAPPEA